MAAPVQSVQIVDFSMGVASFGRPVVPGDSTGRAFFVDSTAPQKGDDVNHGAHPLVPFATIDFAIGQCTANRGDTIYVLPGHVETILTAAGINCDVAGVRLIGFSDGRARPTITLSTSVNASLDINAASVIIDNFVIDMTGIDAIVAGINVKAADPIIRNCEFLFASAAGQANIVIKGNANCNRMRILNNFFNGGTNAGPASAIDVQANADGIEIAYNRIQGSFNLAAVELNTPTNVFVHHNRIQNFAAGQLCLDLDVTGSIEYNTVVGSDLTNVLSSSGAIAALIENYGYDSDTLGVSGTLIPAIGTALVAGSSLVDQIIGNNVSAFRANLVPVVADFTQVAWNTVAKHKLFVVSGRCRVRIIAFCTSDLAAGGAATIKLGHTTNTGAFIAATLATDIDNDEFWLSATPAKTFAYSAIIDQITAEASIGYEIAVTAMTAGRISFYCWWEPIGTTADDVVASTGIAF